MIPETKGKNAVLESVISMANNERIARYNNLLMKIHYYEGTAKQREKYLQPYLKIQDGDIPFTFTNLTNKIIRRKSNVYRKAPVRYFDSEVSYYDEITEEKNTVMKQAERMAHLLGVPAIRVFWNKNKFGYRIIRYYELLFENDAEKPSAIMYPINNGITEPELWVYWDYQNHYVMDDKGIPVKNQAAYGVNDKMANPYSKFNLFPFAFCHESMPFESFYVSGADDIVDANQKIDLALTNLNYAIRYSAIKQAYIKALNLKDVNVTVGYNKIMAVEGDPGQTEIGVIDLQLQLTEMVDSIKFQIQLLERNNDLTINWGIEGAPSGFSLVVQNIDLLSGWEDDLDICRKWERDIYEIEKAVANVDAKKILPDKMNIDFSEIKFPVNQYEERAKWEWEFSHNISTPLDYMKSQSPETPEDELKKRLEENAKLTSSIKAAEKTKPLTFEERLLGANV